jgi:hypothetical protein
MRLTVTGTRLVAADTPGGLWVLGLAFVASGTLVLTVPLFADEWATFGIWERIAVFAIGLSHLAGGLYTIRMHPATTVELDRAGGAGTHHVRKPGERVGAITRFRLADVRDVGVVETKDSDGDPVFEVSMRLADGRELHLQGHPNHGQAAAREQAAAIRRFVGLPALPETDRSVSGPGRD